eukprot:TRINITY_DN3899_c0_g1_i2.p1 TRINITY_DN3899_c0_g1~~TRINITY_DN3899_c0_g1_i2.p1  ORF type:complete len:375 (+),score=54.74 TRINITY_DN3899_c0_g1_i2:144-1268(+)
MERDSVEANASSGASHEQDSAEATPEVSQEQDSAEATRSDSQERDSAEADALSGGSQVLRRLHILPLGESENCGSGSSRFERLSPQLMQLRNSQEIVQAGKLVRHDGTDFVVIKADPADGTLGPETDYYTDGHPVVSFEKIQFSAWGPTVLSKDDLFKQLVKPYFKGEYSPYGASNQKKVRLLYTNQVIKFGEVSLVVEATVPCGLGVVSTRTQIFTIWDTTPEFQKVHIVPFQDTLPRAYNFNIFADYLKPYLNANAHQKFEVNGVFSYQGVQFKVVACEPETTARIGKSTMIFCEGTLNPSLRNLLPPALLAEIDQLPVGLQTLLLSTERSARGLEDVMAPRRQGISAETVQQIERSAKKQSSGKYRDSEEV